MRRDWWSLLPDVLYTPGTFIGACLFSELRNTSGNGVPSQWITRSVVRRVKKKKERRGRRREWRGRGRGDSGGRGKRKRSDRPRLLATRGEKMIVASTQRAQRRIYIYVSPRDVELSSYSMMDVYHVRQRPRHLLHHHHHLLSISPFSFSALPFSFSLSRYWAPSASRK